MKGSLILAMVIVLVSSSTWMGQPANWRGSPAVLAATTQPPASRLGAGLSALLAMKQWTEALVSKAGKRVIAAMDRQGGPTVIIRFNHVLTEAEESAIERQYSLKFSRYQGRANVGPLYSAVVPWARLEALGRDPGVVRVVTEAWPPRIGGLDGARAASNIEPVWLLQDGAGNPVYGTGVNIAIWDYGIDLFHPDFWTADVPATTYEWRDVNGNGQIDPETDVVRMPDPNNPGQMVEYLLRKIVPGADRRSFNPAVDYLYADVNNNRSRDRGRQAGFNENSPGYGEPMFIRHDTQNSLLVALTRSKVYKYLTKVNRVLTTYSRNPGPGELPLIDAPIEDTDSHGTWVSAIAAAGKNGRTYAGAAPQAWAGNDRGLLVATVLGPERPDHSGIHAFCLGESGERSQLQLRVVGRLLSRRQ